MMHFDVLLHHLIELEESDAAGDRHPKSVTDEMYGMVILQKILVLGKDLALGRIFYVALKLSHAAFSGVIEDLVQHFEILQIERFSEFSASKHSADSLDHLDHNGKRIADQHRANGCAENDHQLCGLHQHHELSVLHQVSPDDG